MYIYTHGKLYTPRATGVYDRECRGGRSQLDSSKSTGAMIIKIKLSRFPGYYAPEFKSEIPVDTDLNINSP